MPDDRHGGAAAVFAALNADDSAEDPDDPTGRDIHDTAAAEVLAALNANEDSDCDLPHIGATNVLSILNADKDSDDASVSEVSWVEPHSAVTHLVDNLASGTQQHSSAVVDAVTVLNADDDSDYSAASVSKSQHHCC